jgi:hypothetical protein
MGQYLDSLKKRNITAYLLKGVLTMNIPDGVDESLMAKIKKAAPQIKAELLADDLDDRKPNSSEARESTPLMSAIRAKRKSIACPNCQEVTEAIEYEQPSEGWHYTQCAECGYLGTVCISGMSDQAIEIQKKLDGQGWCIIRSNTLNEPVVVSKAEGIPLPAHLKRCIVYTLSECAILNKELLSQTHKAKRNHGGTVEKLTKEEARLF